MSLLTFQLVERRFYYKLFVQLRSISSRVFPLVSGIILMVNIKRRIALNANSQKVWPAPIFSNKTGVNCEISHTPIHNTMMERDIATPLFFVGNISDIKTQGIGPREVLKHPTKPKIRISNQGPEVDPV